MTTITEFLLARIAEDEDLWRSLAREGVVVTLGTTKVAAPAPWISRHLAECEAKRRIIARHEAWPVLVEQSPAFDMLNDGPTLNAVTFQVAQRIAWVTQQEYRSRFGDEPPTAPILREMALVYADHPDYDEAWRP